MPTKHYKKLSETVNELKSHIRELSKMKEKLVETEYKDKSIVEKCLKLKRKCSFLYSQVLSVTRDLRVQVHLEEKGLKPSQKELRSLRDTMSNVAYEKGQIIRKIRSCESQQVDLEKLEHIVSSEEFKQKASDEKIETENEHDFQMKRLQYELKQRKNLVKEANEIKQKVKTVRGHLDARRKLLEKVLKDKLNTLFKAAQPIREVFGLPKQPLQKPSSSKHLPDELYAIFYSCWCQKHIHRDVDSSVSISVHGVPDLSSKPATKKRKLNERESLATAYSTDDDLHPITLRLQFDKIGVRLTLQLQQSSRLILTQVTLVSKGKWCTEDPQIFCSLLLHHYEIPFTIETDEDDKNKSTINPKQWLAFSWIQQLGCEYLPSQKNTKDEKFELLTLKQLETALAKRLAIQKAFQGQVRALKEKKFISDIDHLFEGRQAQSTFLKFDQKEMRRKFEEVSGEEQTREESANNKYFGVTFQHGKVYLQALVNQKPGYPQVRPEIRVQYLMGKTSKVSESEIFKEKAATETVTQALKTRSSFDNSCRAIELAITQDSRLEEESNQVHILSILLKKVQLCFDMHMNSDGESRSQFERQFHGKDRSQNYTEV